MRQGEVTIGVTGGVHARMALRLARVVEAHSSSVFLLTPRPVSLARVFDVMELGLEQGASVTVVADGRDEQAALTAVLELLRSGE
ncbi:MULTISPECIES: HPr family phosphocarrier protein [unclassified Luteococcus]|uniref:HPr family phosphocarrier protein n=1 Tax=unclassified Luteococcus TaxID=2639923 RepID=UPI00313DFDA5